MTLEIYTTLVNGIPADTGCYVDGHWGQYGPDHLADRAEEFGWTPDFVEVTDRRIGVKNDPRVLRALADQYDALADTYTGDDPGSPNANKAKHYRDLAITAWEAHTEAADDIERWLNDHTATMCVTCGAAISWADDANSTLDEPQWVHVDWGEHEEPTVPRRFVWHWSDGEFFLSPICDDPDECDDDTCAHWE